MRIVGVHKEYGRTPYFFCCQLGNKVCFILILTFSNGFGLFLFPLLSCNGHCRRKREGKGKTGEKRGKNR